MMQTDHEYIGELYDYFDAAFLKLFLKNGAICERDEFETKVKAKRNEMIFGRSLVQTYTGYKKRFLDGV